MQWFVAKDSSEPHRSSACATGPASGHVGAVDNWGLPGGVLGVLWGGHGGRGLMTFWLAGLIVVVSLAVLTGRMDRFKV